MESDEEKWVWHKTLYKMGDKMNKVHRNNRRDKMKLQRQVFQSTAVFAIRSSCTKQLHEACADTRVKVVNFTKS